MAGTPTTNYSFPTITDNDVIDGVSAINGLASAVDTALKGVADTIPASGGGGSVTAGTGISVSGSTVSVDTEWLTAQINAAIEAKKATTWGELNTDGFISGGVS